MWGRAREILRLSRKQRDIAFNRFIARPLAAVALTGIERTALTPNQVTLLSLACFGVAVGLLVALPSYAGLWIAVAVLELSYVLDCADGQLARLRGTSSAIGAHLDFLADELKALALVVGVTVRLWLRDGRSEWLVEGLIGLGLLAAGLALTTFRRRPEYAAATSERVDAGAGDYGPGTAQAASPAEAPAAARGPVALMMAAGQFIVHYPSHLPIFALFDRMDIFLHVYLLANAAHTARCVLAVAVKLGRR